MLMLVLLLQALPLSALAAAGHVLTDEELAAAYALTGFGEDRGIGLAIVRDGRADHLVGLGGAGPAAGVEVDLADQEEGVVGEEARRVVLGDAAEDHGGVAGLAAGELALALEEERLGLEFAVLGAHGLAEIGPGLVELALVDLVAA